MGYTHREQNILLWDEEEQEKEWEILKHARWWKAIKKFSSQTCL